MKLYVTTTTDGLDRSAEQALTWRLPELKGGQWRPGEITESDSSSLVLRHGDALLDVLDEAIFIAQPEPESLEQTSPELRVARARLVAGTNWDTTVAARFGLDCVEHGLGDAADVELPHGKTLGEVIADARAFLDRSSDDAEQHLSVLARLSAARRVKKSASEIGEVAFETLREDLANELDATEDSAWNTVAAFGDAVIAVVEALRHVALPRYIGARENSPDPGAASAPAVQPRVFGTPWGPVMIGGEYRSPYLPAAIAAREATVRIREAIAERSGEKACRIERAWQVAHLEELL